MATATLQWPDYVVFSVTLAMTLAIGVYYGYRDRHAKDTDTFLLAGRRLPLLPVVLSLFVGWMTSISFIGDPVEVYFYGSVYWWFGVGYCLSLPIVAHVFGPIYYQLRITSVYEYLKLRYNVYMRSLGSVGYGFWALPFMGIGLYSPSVALGQMTGLQPWIAILVLGIICMFYTSLGGLKAVVWSDTIQAFIMLGGLIAIVVEGSKAVGGIEMVWDIADKGGRVNFLQWGGNPLTRASGWIYLVGGFFQTYDSWTAGQGLVQRGATLPSVNMVKLAVYLCIPCYLLFTTLFWLVGMVMYSYYAECDPLTSGVIERTDQLVPLLAVEILGKYPGVSGLFLASLCAAALSSISSGQNALAAVTLRDTIEPLYEKCAGRALDEASSIGIVRGLSLAFGVINIGLALLVLLLRDSAVFALTIKLTGTIGGPLAGVFSLGVFTRFVDTPSAMIAYLSSLALSMWLALGSIFGPASPLAPQELPLSTDSCPVANYSTVASTTWTSGIFTTDIPEPISFHVSHLYYLSPPLYAPLAWSLTMVIGLLLGSISVCIRGHPDKREKYSVGDNYQAEGSTIAIVGLTNSYDTFRDTEKTAEHVFS